MVRQYPIPGALAAMAAIGAEADIVVLTNVGPEHQQGRIEQLARHDFQDRKSTRLNSSHSCAARLPSFASKKKQHNAVSDEALNHQKSATNHYSNSRKYITHNICNESR